MIRHLLLPLALLAACSEGDGKDTAQTTPTGTDGTAIQDDLYAFPSRFAEGESSVAHSGQSARQVLIKDLKSWMGGLTERVDGGWFPEAGDVEAELDFYFSFDGASSGEVPLALSTDPAPLQETYGALSTSANLVGKIAGNDEVGQHKDWSTQLVGWSDPAVTTPESLIRHWFAQVDQAAVDRSLGTVPLDPTGAPIGAVTLTAEGQDLTQLTEKFLHGAVSFSQATDDYLDDDLEGKGLLSDHTGADEGAPYTALEHHWDEGFGYFGAAHQYAQLSDDLIADVGYDDYDADGAIDLTSEYCFGASTNAAKRDRGAASPTDFTTEAWEGFYRGRALIYSVDGALSDGQQSALQNHRDQAIEAWEKALAATVVHYINETLQDMNAFGTGDYVFADHAKHWSEGKGFAFAFQFNPRSPMADGDFATLHDLLGQAPILPDADPAAIAAYRDDLLAARDLLGATYGFDAANLGDDNGENGW